MISKIRAKVANISPTKRNVLILSSGSVLGQGLVIATSPFLSRMYAQDAFGLLALYTSFATIVASVCTGKYEQAIFHPVEDRKALNLMSFALGLSFILSVLFFLILLGLSSVHLEIKILNNLGRLVFFLPMTTFLVAVNSCFQLWFQRKEQYKIASVNTLLQSVFLIILNFGFFFFGFTRFGLLLGYVFAMMVPIVLYMFTFLKHYPGLVNSAHINFSAARAAAREYVNFPKYILVSEFVLTLSQQFFPILLTSLYSSSVVGLFSFSNRILRIPSILLSNSVWGVFRNEAVKVKTDAPAFRALYMKTLRSLLRSGFVPFLILAICGQFIFRIVFGTGWSRAGLYSQIMAFYLFSEFLYYPLSSTFMIYNKQKINMWLQLLTLAGCIGGLVAGKYLGGDLVSIALMSVSGIITNLFALYLSYKMIGNE